MTFDPGRLWSVLVQGHQNYRSNIYKTGDRYDAGVNGSRIGSHLWAIDWHHDLWPWMILNCCSSRSSKLHAKYLKNDDRYRQHWTDSKFAWTLGLSCLEQRLIVQFCVICFFGWTVCKLAFERWSNVIDPALYEHRVMKIKTLFNIMHFLATAPFRWY